jgi:dUTP pyrophosphatase
MDVKIKKLSEKAVIPKYAKEGDAGLDLVATSYNFQNGRHVYGTGLAIEIPKGYVGLIFPRSSICKYDLRLTNCVGVIDSGYRGEIKFQFENRGMDVSIDASGALCPGENNYNIYKVNERVGQIIIIPYPQIELIEVNELSNTQRGTGGYGSSGV